MFCSIWLDVIDSLWLSTVAQSHLLEVIWTASRLRNITHLHIVGTHVLYIATSREGLNATMMLLLILVAHLSFMSLGYI